MVEKRNRLVGELKVIEASILSNLHTTASLIADEHGSFEVVRGSKRSENPCSQGSTPKRMRFESGASVVVGYDCKHDISKSKQLYSCCCTM